MQLQTISKAIAGGLVTLVVGYLSKYGLHISPVVNDALGTIAYAVVFYIAGHLVVYFSPKNRTTV